jgi:glycosyltransferase involved in cell wall biosynthesis
MRMMRRADKKCDSLQEITALEPVSIIITAHDESYELEQNLESILKQDYSPGYEVIVVDTASTDETPEVLKRLKAGNPNLYTTFTPDSSRYMSRKKLAITLGVKAAHHEWVIIMDANCKPVDEHWLTSVASHFDARNDIVLVYSNYDDDTAKFHRYERALEQNFILGKAARGNAYRAATSCIAVRKELINYQSNLRYLRGEYDFIVNDNASAKRTSVAIEPTSRLIQMEPTKKQLRNRHLFDINTISHLHRTKIAYSSLAASTILLLLTHTLIIADIIYGILFKDVIAGATAFIGILALMLVFIIDSKRFMRYDLKIPFYILPFYQLRLIFSAVIYQIRYITTDKRDFIRK